MSTPYDPAPYQSPPPPQPFSIGTALSYGWERFRTNPAPFILLVLIMLVASFLISLPFGVLSGLTSTNTADSTGLSFETGIGTGFSFMQSLGNMLSSLVAMVFSAALVKGALDTTRGQQVTLGSMFDGLPWGQVLIAGIIVSIGSSIGFLLCILPGFVVLLLTMWVNYFIVGHNQDAITAMKSSFSLVTKRPGESLIAGIVCFIIAVLGVCLLCVGLLVTVPISVLALAWSFRTLVGEQPV